MANKEGRKTMPYYCKKCGAIVVGRYCSSCGTKATSDFADFRREQRRIGKAFCEAAYNNHRISSADRNFASRLATLAADIAFDRIMPVRCMNVDCFDAVSSHCWSLLDDWKDLSDILFERAAAVLLKERTSPAEATAEEVAGIIVEKLKSPGGEPYA